MNEIGYLGEPIVIPYGGDSAKLRGDTGGASLAEIFRSQLLDIQVTYYTPLIYFHCLLLIIFYFDSMVVLNILGVV